MDLPAQAALGVHILFGTGAVIAGALPIFAPKRKGFHTRWGRRFVFCMGFVLSSAVILTLLFMNPYFAALTVTSGILTISGVRVLRRKRPDLRGEDRAKAVDWLVAFATLAVGALVLRMQADGDAGGNPVVIYALVGSAFVPDPWKQLWAAILFNVLTVAMIVWYARRRRMARSAAGLDAARPA
jgi:amino acid transporter